MALAKKGMPATVCCYAPCHWRDREFPLIKCEINENCEQCTLCTLNYNFINARFDLMAITNNCVALDDRTHTPTHTHTHTTCLYVYLIQCERKSLHSGKVKYFVKLQFGVKNKCAASTGNRIYFYWHLLPQLQLQLHSHHLLRGKRAAKNR